MKIRINLLFTFLFLLPVFFLRSQTTTTGTTHEVKGKITDDMTGEPLVGASVSYEKGKGVQTDTSGSFSLMLPDGKYDLKISYIGYTPIQKKITVEGQDQAIDNLLLANANNLDEVEIAADVAKTRETPVAFSDVDAKQINEELGANDITMLLNSTPGAYASQQGGGAGDSRVNIRGFDQRNIAVLVDGVPINDMENGQVYWSNWAGLAEVTKKMQVQRGLGASRLAVPSVGGVMNIITSPVDYKQFFTVKENLGTNNFQRYSAAYNSGLIKNKFGITLAGSYSEGDGYVTQTWQKSWSYFAKVNYKINSKNLLVFSASGAPQSHGQRSFAINMVYHDRTFARKQGINADSIYATPNPYTTSDIGSRGTTYSPDWGYLNGKPFSTKINFFHKPLLNLSYFLTINPRFSFSNVLYYSSGKGGGTTLSAFPPYDKTGTGQLNIQPYYNFNIANTGTHVAIPGKRQADYIQYASMNNHNWIGTLSTFKFRQSNQLDYLAGIDARYYIGTHYQTPYDMLGGEYTTNTGDKNLDYTDKRNSVKYIGDKINYYYQSKISWLGLFGQAEYKTKRITAFITATGNQTGYQVINYFSRKDLVLDDNTVIPQVVGNGETFYRDGVSQGTKPNNIPASVAPDGSMTFFDAVTNKKVTILPNHETYEFSSPKARTSISEVKSYTGYTLKGGLNYKLDRNHNVFANLGHMSIAPRFTNVFDRSGSEVQGSTNQLIFTGEIGYSIKYSQVALNINGYMTQWGNKPLDFASSVPDPATNASVYYNVNGVDAMLKGIEMDMSYKPFKYLEVKAFGTLADWRWNSGGVVQVYTETGTLLKTVNFDAKGVHVGNAPQRQIGTSVRYELKGFYIKPQFTYFEKMYAQFDPTNLTLDEATNKDYRRSESWKMPAYGLVDLYLGYRVMANNTKIEITGSMNNVLNTVYLSDATFVTSSNSILPNQYDASRAFVWMGLGRRINIGVKVTF